MIDGQLILESLPSLISGAWVSLQIAFFATWIGLTLGIVLGFAERSQKKILRYSATTYATLFRGTPMLVQILFVYYVLPQFGIRISPFWAATLAIGLNSGAYISQIVRSGISSVQKGQWEAAHTLGLSRWQTVRYIIFPQALRIALPGLGNEWITLVKDSSLASIIGVMELSKEGSVIRSRTYDAFSILLAVSCIYLILTTTLSCIVRNLEKRWHLDV